MRYIRAITAIAASLLLSSFLALACGCGEGSASGNPNAVPPDAPNVHEGWFAADVPDGWSSKAGDTEFHAPDGKRIVKVALKVGRAHDAAESMSTFGPTYRMSEPVHAGFYTFESVALVFDNADSRVFFADVADGYYAEISAFELTEADPDMMCFLNSFTVVDVEDLYVAQQAYRGVPDAAPAKTSNLSARK